MPMIPPHNSLVRYDNPIQVSSSKDLGKGSKQAAGKKADQKTQPTPTEDILNSILPPREWTEEGQLWVQYVSSTPATRSDVIALQAQLDQKLQARQARETGICPIREELYVQCFDELIRQVTINCAERGLLLLRVRDEIRMTIASYQTLYESSIAFGMRKALQAEQHKADMLNKIKALEKEKSDLDKQVKVYIGKCFDAEAKDAARRAEEAQKHREEVDALKKHNAMLKKELETVLSIPTATKDDAKDKSDKSKDGSKDPKKDLRASGAGTGAGSGAGGPKSGAAAVPGGSGTPAIGSKDDGKQKAGAATATATPAPKPGDFGLGPARVGSTLMST